MAMGAFGACLMMDAALPRRHSLLPFIAYTTVRGISWSLYDISYVQGTMGAFEHDFQLVATPIFAILNYVFLYYTWKGSFAKVGIAPLVGEIPFALVSAVMYQFTYVLFNNTIPAEYRGYLGPNTVFFSFGTLALFMLILRLMRPLYAWFKRLEFKREKLWNATTISAIAVPTIIRMFSADQLTESTIIEIAVGAALFVTLAVYIANEYRIGQKRKKLLQRESQLANQYDASIRDQLAYLESCSKTFEEVEAKAANLESAKSSSELQERAEQLHALCEKLRHGIYSDCPALDAVLVAARDELSACNADAEFRIPPLGDSAVQAAAIIQGMLSWAAKTCLASKTDENASTKPKVSLRAIRSMNQLIFVLKMPSNKRRRFPKNVVTERMAAFDGVVNEIDDDMNKTIHVMVADCKGM